jgi:short-chain fatty acids transporter
LLLIWINEAILMRTNMSQQQPCEIPGRTVMTTTTSTAASSPNPVQQEGLMVRTAIGFTAWAERWFPDAFIFVAIAVVVVAFAALINGASPTAVSVAFGNGFWSLITFTMQMAFVAIGGYVVATSAPAQRLIRWLADLPTTGASAVGLVAIISILASLLNWGLSLILGGLLVVALAARRELRMDYRAAAAAAYLGLGATWAMGLSSSAAQLQANAASLPNGIQRLDPTRRRLPHHFDAPRLP